MSVTEHITYDNVFTLSWFSVPEQKTTKEEWTERFECVYNCSSDYIALNKSVSDAYIQYITYKHKHLFTDDTETTSAMMWHLHGIYYNKYKTQSALKIPIIKAYKERFPSIKKPSCDVEHYIECCEKYASHRLKGILYDLPFQVETPDPAPDPEDKKPCVEGGVWWDTVKDQLIKSKATGTGAGAGTGAGVGIKEKKKNVKKHTLSILLTQEKEKTRKLQEMLSANVGLSTNSNTSYSP